MKKRLVLLNIVFGGLLIGSPSGYAQNTMSISVDRSSAVGPASIIANYIGVQGEVMSHDDRFEATAWKAVGMRTDSVPLIDDAGIYNNRGIEVSRGPTPPSGKVRGPFGPNNDLWIRTDYFDASIALYRAKLGANDSQLQLTIEVMPKVLSYLPESPNYSKMSAASREEWIATIVEIAKYLEEIGWSHWAFSLMGEPETLFYGENQGPNVPGIEESYARLWIDTERAFDSVHPGTLVFAVANGVYSSSLLGQLRGNPDEIGLDHYVAALRRVDPTFQPKAFGVQGYYWAGRRGYGPERLLSVADYIRSVFAANGLDPGVALSLEGFNGILGSPEYVNPLLLSPRQRKYYGQYVLDQEAAFTLSSLMEFIKAGGRGFAYTYYYTWNLEFNPECGGGDGFPHQSMISTKYPSIGEGGEFGPGCIIPASTHACGRATYQIFNLLSRMTQGNIVSANVEAPLGGELSVLATAGGRDTRVLLANHYGARLNRGKLKILGLNPRKRYRVTTSEIASQSNLCARILTKKRTFRANSAGALVIKIPATSRSILQFSLDEI